jgi:hypothetical protein
MQAFDFLTVAFHFPQLRFKFLVMLTRGRRRGLWL